MCAYTHVLLMMIIIIIISKKLKKQLGTVTHTFKSVCERHMQRDLCESEDRIGSFRLARAAK